MQRIKNSSGLPNLPDSNSVESKRIAQNLAESTSIGGHLNFNILSCAYIILLVAIIVTIATYFLICTTRKPQH